MSERLPKSLRRLAALPPYDRQPLTATDGAQVVGWSWPPAPVADVPKCKCSHAKRNHGTDRRDRATCFGSAVCGCTTYRPQETEVSNDPDTIETEVFDCPTCDGEGSLVEDGVLDTCPACDGDGVIEE